MAELNTDFRALCAKLTNELSGYKMANPMHDYFLLNRARAALAAEVEPLADEEVARMVAWLREIAQLWEPDAPRAKQLFRAAELLERLAPQPVPEGPSDEELVNFRNRATADCCASRSNNGADLLSGDDLVECQAAGLRAVLARWGTSNLTPARSSLGDESQPVQEGPSDQEIEEWAAASSVPGEFLDPDSGRWERCLSSEEFCATVRAALARWGQS